MYRSFFGLNERPFDLTPNPRFVVLTATHREALSSLEYGVASHRGITVVIGEAGTGKTTLIRLALERQGARVHCVHLPNPALTRAEFFETLAVHFSLSPEARTSKAVFLIELEALLQERHARGETTVLIVDEAQSIPRDLLEEIRLLGNVETDETKLLSIVLAGQPELAARLNDENLRQLKQRIAMRCQLRPLTLAETAAYLAGRVQAAGGLGAQVFTRDAVVLIHDRSAGIPRTINVICDNALLTAFALRHKPVNTEIVKEVCRDLDLEVSTNDEHEVTASGEAPAAQENRPSRAPSRILAFEGAGHDGGTASAQPQTGTADEKGMFKEMYPKRRRFSFF